MQCLSQGAAVSHSTPSMTVDVSESAFRAGTLGPPTGGPGAVQSHDVRYRKGSSGR